MKHTCRFPGCTVRMQTEHGRELHEKMCHGFSDTWMVEEVFAQVQAQSGLLEIDIPMDQQLAFNQDLIIIEAAMDAMKNSCCC